jgi:hypothetical protein
LEQTTKHQTNINIMGLSTSHGCYLGSYSSFHRWRTEIGRVAGYPTEIHREDFCGIRTLKEHLTINCAGFPQNYVLGEWDQLPQDPLLILLCHSDWNGRIKSEHCAPLASALEPLVPKLAGSAEDGRTDAGAAKEFIDGLRAASAAGEDVEFF